MLPRDCCGAEQCRAAFTAAGLLTSKPSGTAFSSAYFLSKLNCNCGLQMDSSTYAFLHSYAGSAIGLWLGSKQGTAFLLYPGCLLREGETSAVGTGLTKGIGT